MTEDLNTTLPEEDYNPDLLTLLDEDENEHTFEVLDRIELESGERYVALLEVHENVQELLDDNGELIILKVVEEDGEELLATIESEDEFYEVLPLFEERLSDLFEIEEEND